jgi:protein-tyrosine phosphatase
MARLSSKVRRWAGAGVLLVLSAALGAAVWHVWLEDRLIPKRWGMVEPGLIYCSAWLPPPLLKQMLLQYRIRWIVDLTLANPTDARQQAEKALAAELGIEYRNYPLYGSGIGEVWNYARAVGVMAVAKRERKPLWVHCSAGVQRTGGVVAAYRLLIEQRPPAEAYAELVRNGWDPRQDRILLEFLNGHMLELAERLQEMEIIAVLPEPLPQLGP